MWYDDNLIRIERLDYILDQFRPEILHPNDPKYIPYWRNLRKKCIEGIWVEQFGKYRYTPGRLGFYGVFFRFNEWDEETKVRVTNQPVGIRDLEWHSAYSMVEASGFSGYENDDKYTSDRGIFEIQKYRDMKLGDKRYHHMIKPNGDFKEFIDPRENLFLLRDTDQLGRPLYYNEARNDVLMGSRGGGKAVLLIEPILTSKGWVKMGDVKIGDNIVNRYGKPGKITNIIPQGKRQVWLVTLQDGRKIKCSDNHLWTVQLATKKEKVISTIDMYNQGVSIFHEKGNVYKFKIPNCNPIQFKEKDLPIDPYVLGYLLGNGTLTTLTPKVASDDEFVIEEFRKRLEGFEIKYDKHTTTNYTIVDRRKVFIQGEKQPVFKNRLRLALEELNLTQTCENKFIPKMYKFSSIDQRMELIRGLMDSDGHVTKDGSAEFSNTNLNLIEDMAEILRSLGIRCQIGKDNRAGQKHNIKDWEGERSEYYRLYINTTKDICKLPRKLERLKNKKYTNSQDFVSIVNIRPLDEYEEQQCISVDCKDHTFIIGNYVVTHNSYQKAGMLMLPNICFSNLKHYNIGDTLNSQASIEIITSGGGKGTELLEKVREGMDALNDERNTELGVWVYKDGSIESCPFYKKMTGDITANNKEKPWKNIYPIKKGNEWTTGGNEDVIYNTANALNQKNSNVKSAGGRRTDVVYEEFGTFAPGILLNSWGNNEGLVSEAGYKMASQHGIGTSGNLETIIEAKKIFTHPKQYRCLEYRYRHDPDNTYGRFLPVWWVDPRFKDKDGNTNVAEAKAYHQEKIDKLIEEGNPPDVILNHKMNNPMEIEDMWISGTGTLMPVEEAKKRRTILLKGNYYEQIGTPIKLFWDTNTENGVNYTIMQNAEPFYHFPYKGKKDLEGAFLMFIHPDKLRVNGEFPPDIVFTLVDPYKAEEWDKGGSLGAVYFIVNPKYIPFGKPGNCLAACYNGKPERGVDAFAEIVCQGYALYGNGKQTVWYEDVMGGDKIRAMFIKKNRLFGLALRPQFEQGNHIFLKNVRQTGYIIGKDKSLLWSNLADWWKEETTLTIMEDGKSETETKMNIERWPDLFSLNQAIHADGKLNVDAVSAMQAISLAIGESSQREILKQQTGTNVEILRQYVQKYHKKLRVS